MNHLEYKKEIWLRRHTSYGASACGRNGTFDPRHIVVVNWYLKGIQSVNIDVHSSRSGGVPPLHLRMPYDEARQLAESILEIVGKGVDSDAKEVV